MFLNSTETDLKCLIHVAEVSLLAVGSNDVAHGCKEAQGVNEGKEARSNDKDSEFEEDEDGADEESSDC